MKPKHLIIGTIIALIVIMAVVMVLKSGKTSNSEQVAPKTDLSQ